MIDPGELLRLARNAKGWSQRDLAAAAGVSNGAVAKIEAGASPSWRTMATLLGAAGIDLTPVPAVKADFDVDARICAHLMCHPLDRLANHGLPEELIAELDRDVHDDAPIVTGAAAAFFWVPRGLLDLALPESWLFTHAASGATYPVRPESPTTSIRVVGPRSALAAAVPLARAAQLWDELIDRDAAGRRDAQHRDPAIDDRVERALWPTSIGRNLAAGRDLDHHRRAPWAIRRRRPQPVLRS